MGDTAPPRTMNNPSYGNCQRAPAERHVNDNYTHNLRNDYNHQNRPQRLQYWPTQSDNDDMHRHHQPFGFVSPAGHHHHGHHPANNDSDQQPTGGQEAYPLFFGIEHLFSPCHGPPAFEVEAVVEYGFSIHAYIGADPSTEARTMWPHHLQVISSEYPGRLPPSAFQDGHDGTHMNINDITITELERLRPFTLVVSSTQCQPWSRTGSRLDWQDHRSRAFSSIINFIRFYLSSQPTPDIRNCVNNVAAIKLADPGPFSGYNIHNPVAGRTTSLLPMPAFQFSNADYMMDEFQPSGQQEGAHAPPPMLPSAALASAQEGPPSPHHNEQHPPHHQEGDATALSAPHTSKHAQLPSHYVGLSDYHPTLVASAIAAVVRPHSARLTALALPAPTVRVSTAPRTYQEDICSTRPDDWKTSMNHEINSITTMALFVWVNVPELRRNNESAVIQQMAWAFTAQHKDGNIIRREAGVIVRGNILTTGETYNDAKTYAPVVHFVALRTTIAITVQLTWELYQFDVRCVFLNADRNADTYDYLSPGCGHKDRAWNPDEALYDLPQAPKAWFLCFSSFLRDFDFIDSAPDGVIHLHRETCIIDILTTFHMTESKPRRLPCTMNTNFHNTAVTYRAEVRRQRGHVYYRSGVRGALRGLHMSGGYSRSSAPSSATPLLPRCKYAGTTAHASFRCNMV
eukprot:jgi/Tetstr1/428504/TSEL_018515.t1